MEGMARKMRWNKMAFMSLLLAVSLLLGGCSTWQRTIKDGQTANHIVDSEPSAVVPLSDIPKLEGYQAAAGNEAFYLYYHPETLDVLLQDRRSGAKWNMIPDGWEEDPYATGPARMYLGSGVILDVYDPNKNQTSSVASYSDSVRKNGASVTASPAGFDVTYLFKSSGIQLTVQYVLTKQGLQVKIPQESISEGDGGQLISKISLMPYFGSAALDEKGYLLVPDGSGALVDFNGTPTSLRQQTEVVYGFDNSIALSSMPSRSQTYSLPLFGIKKANGAMVGVIQNGEAMARITAGMAGSGSSRYKIYPVFTYRDIHTLILYEGKSTERYVNDISPEANRSDLSVQYLFIAGENCEYSQMADLYRTYLIENGMLNKAKNFFAMDLSLIGAIREDVTVLGIKTTQTNALTTFQQAETILKALGDAGIDQINLTLLGVQEGGWQYDKIGTFSPDNALGSKKDFEQLLNFTEQKGISLSISAELINIYRNAGAFSAGKDAVRQLTDAYSMQKIWNVVDGSRKSGSRSYYLMEPSKLFPFTKSFVESVPEGVSVTVNDIGNKIYSQFGKKNFTTRQEALDEWTKTLALLKENCDEVKVNGANSYVLPYATYLSGLPETSSGTDMETRSIPFYQLVVHGYIPYSFTAGNLRNNQQDEFLKMIEYGACPSWIFGADESSRLKETQYNNNYSSNYADWVNTAAKEYQLLSELYAECADSVMTGHRRVAEDVYETTYECGTKILVNYGSTSYTADGVTVGAKDYTVVRGEQA